MLDSEARFLTSLSRHVHRLDREPFDSCLITTVCASALFCLQSAVFAGTCPQTFRTLSHHSPVFAALRLYAVVGLKIAWPTITLVLCLVPVCTNIVSLPRSPRPSFFMRFPGSPEPHIEQHTNSC